MKKDLKMLVPLLYFIIVAGILFLLLSTGSLPDYVNQIFVFGSYYGIGCLYSIFIVIFLFMTDESEKPAWLGIKLALALSLTWISLFFLSITVVGPVLSVFLGTAASPLTVFISTLMGTELFLSILSKWEKFPKINKRPVSILFAILTSILGLPLLQTENSFSSIKTISFTNIVLICIVWQMAMTYYLWKRMKIVNPIVS